MKRKDYCEGCERGYHIDGEVRTACYACARAAMGERDAEKRKREKLDIVVYHQVELAGPICYADVQLCGSKNTAHVRWWYNRSPQQHDQCILCVLTQRFGPVEAARIAKRGKERKRT